MESEGPSENKPRPVVYLANEYGFSKSSKVSLEPFIKELEELGYEVNEPFQRTTKTDFSSDDWGWKIIEQNKADLERSDLLFCVCNGVNLDPGAMVEVGIMIQAGKPVCLFRDDVRNINEFEGLPLNIMLFTGMTPSTWQEYFYKSLSELKDSNKFLARFIKQ